MGRKKELALTEKEARRFNKALNAQEEKLAFANALNFYMAREGKRQQDLIDDLGFQSGTVSSWVNGKNLPRNNAVERLASYLRTTAENLYHLPIECEFEDVIEEYERDITADIDAVFGKIRSKKRPLVYGGNELSEEVTDVLSAAVNLVRKGKSDRRKPSE